MRIPTAHTSAFFFSPLLYLATFETHARLIRHIISYHIISYHHHHSPTLPCLVLCGVMFRPSRLVSSCLSEGRIGIRNGGDMI